MTRIVYIGNFEPPHSTENDLYRTMLDMGVEVEPIQEQHEVGWERLIPQLVSGERPDAIMWTSTASLRERIRPTLQRRLQIQAHYAGVPTIAVHLDRWWGLTRQTTLYNEPFFRCQHVFTADGHDPKMWEAAGINHHWLLPAIAPHNAHRGTPDPSFESEVAFVGGWQNYGHTEWAHRGQLVKFLQREYEGRVRFWPEPGQHAVRGEALNDLYASVKVVVGDSCLVPDPITAQPWTRYCSDRVFETMGRGACLVHPYVAGVIGENLANLVVSPIHCVGWRLGDWDELHETLDAVLELDSQRALVAKAGFELVADHHTYRHRLEDIFDIVGVQW